MRLDHIAYRVADRHKTVEFFKNAFGYKVQTEFDIQFNDGTTARCFALEPPEKVEWMPWTTNIVLPPWGNPNDYEDPPHSHHLPPEIFVSDGTPDSIVGRWVAKRDGVGGIHHLAYQVESVQAKMDEWKQKGYAEFTTQSPLTCPDLTQVFTKPSLLTGVIYEFIERGKHGFCQDNVKDLMISTANVDSKVSADHPDASVSHP
jgi:catechol 2,3-dioxygenase-like lactoylglutathione lyase family enzyme